MAKQKLLHLTTLAGGLRCKVEGLSAEDGDLIDQNKEIGLSIGMRTPFYETVMHAIGAGWRLLAPPAHHWDTDFSCEIWEWWLEK